MLMVVKPGIVFTSLTKIRRRSRASRKSTRAMPAPSTALKASIDSRRISSDAEVRSSAGMMTFDPASRYFAS